MVNFANRPLLATSASLDIEVKQQGLFNSTKTKIQATTYRNGTLVSTFNFVQGSGTSSSTVTYCNAKDNDNCQWSITSPQYFDTLRLKAVAASFSLEGGADPTSSSQTVKPLPTTFALVSEVDEVVPCTIGSSISDGATNVTYYGNPDGTTSCDGQGIGVVLKSTADRVEFLKPSDDPTAQFVLDIDWSVPLPSGPAQVPGTKVDFLNTTSTEDDMEIGGRPGAIYDTSTPETGGDHHPARSLTW